MTEPTDTVEAARNALWDAINAEASWIREHGEGNIGTRTRIVELIETEYPAALRADERSKAQPDTCECGVHRNERCIVCGYLMHGATLDCDNQHHDYAPQAQPESALRAAAREDIESLKWDLSVEPSRPDLDAQYVIVNRESLARVVAALDGAPYEPSEAEVQRAVKAWVSTPGVYEDAMRAALKEARG